jgi:hypothetical protein
MSTCLMKYVRNERRKKGNWEGQGKKERRKKGKAKRMRKERKRKLRKYRLFSPLHP